MYGGNVGLARLLLMLVDRCHYCIEVNARRARLVLGWVTVFGRVFHLGM